MRTRREGALSDAASAAILLILAQAAARLVGSGDLSRFVRPSFGPLVGAAALALGALGVWTLVSVESSAEGAVRRHSHGGRAPLLLLVPVLLVLFALPAPLGSALLAAPAGAIAAPAGRSAPPSAADGLGRDADGYVLFPDLAEDSVSDLELDEFVERSMLGAPRALLGRRVRVLGFAARGEAGEELLARFRIVCCAADAIPFSVRLEGTGALVRDQWYRVEGTVVAVGEVPVLEATATTAVDAPEVPYL